MLCLDSTASNIKKGSNFFAFSNHLKSTIHLKFNTFTKQNSGKWCLMLVTHSDFIFLNISSLSIGGFYCIVYNTQNEKSFLLFLHRLKFSILLHPQIYSLEKQFSRVSFRLRNIWIMALRMFADSIRKFKTKRTFIKQRDKINSSKRMFMPQYIVALKTSKTVEISTNEQRNARIFL